MTAADPRIARVEASLAAACETALARGAVLIRYADEATGPAALDGRAACSSPWDAMTLYGEEDDDVELTDYALDEYVAIEMGWDGDVGWLRAHEAVRPWWALGARLAERFTPVSASTLEAR